MRALEPLDTTRWGVVPVVPPPRSVGGTPTLLDTCPEGAGWVVSTVHLTSILKADMTAYKHTLPAHK